MKRALYFSLALNAGFIIFFVGRRIYNYSKWSTHAPHPSDERNMGDVNHFKNFEIDSNDIVFIGNSLTKRFPLHEYFGNIKNRGIEGNTIDHLINRIDQITDGKPQKIFVEIGINDLRRGSSVQLVEQHLKMLITTIKHKTPCSKLYIQSLTPIRDQYKILMPKVKEVNSFLGEYCREQNISYIDIYSPLQKDGYLDSTLTIDGVHLNYKGYKLWKTAIDPYVSPAQDRIYGGNAVKKTE